MPDERQKVAMSAVDRRLSHFATQLEKSNFGAYVSLLLRPWRMFWINFLGGLARGIGIGVGFTILAAFFVYLLQALSVLNLPIVGSFIADLVRIVQAQLHTPTI